MKHVIVIETVDSQDGVIDKELQRALMRAVEIGVEEIGGASCVVLGSFNAKSAIAATHEMFNAPKWEGGL